ncbi:MULTISPECIES: DUF4252 domain-containing protein [unclassified Algibacter]|uniref:DUF4252 domain-containing protein n=1 Tax=unclassified Algibacter TaxID=2615009 RepID=UPI00131EB2FE|nr:MULTISPECIES: DUF4252 domain-containing protein [unclassified Algibacter]MCL5128763.1 DUF4252 domain-containing protein [Algibacter sp. L4_22]
MKKIYIGFSLCFLLFSCGSSFQGFYNNHKADMGTTSFQVPNFMKSVLSQISPELNNTIGNISDLKFIKFDALNKFKRESLIAEMNAITNGGYTDVFRKNDVSNTRIISVKELGAVVTDAIIFNSTENETTAYYLQGNFDPEKIKSFANQNVFNEFSNSLMQSYQTNTTPSFNPEK